MHELSVAGAVLATAIRHADERRVEVVAMRVGALRQVAPESLRFYWEIVSRDTVCEGAGLELAVIDTRLRCADCEREWEPELASFRCPACGSAEVAVVAGNELEVDYIEVTEAVNA